MPEDTTIINGGEAPLAAKSPAGNTFTAVDQPKLMQQNGGQAPDPGSSVQQVAATNLQPGTIAAVDAGEGQPTGGFVRAR